MKSDTQIFRPGTSYLQYLLRVGGNRRPFFGLITNIAAIIFIPFSILSGNWLFLLCIFYLLWSYFWYYQISKEYIELTASHLIYTSYNLFGKPIKTETPFDEILNIVFLLIRHGFFKIYKINMIRALDRNEPLLFRKRTGSYSFTYWDNHVVEKIEQELKIRLPRVSFEEPHS